MQPVVEISMWGAPISTAAILRCVLSTFRVRCHEQQARIIAHYQVVEAHQVVVDDSVDQDTIIVEDFDGGEYGRLTGCYTPD